MKKNKTPSSINSPSTTVKVSRGKNHRGINSPLSRNGSNSPSPMSKRQSSCFSSSP